MLIPRIENTWSAREVVREIDHRPRLLTRVTVSGYFVQRAMVPVMRLVGESIVNSWFTEISADERELRGYFTGGLPQEGFVEFGYADEPLDRVPIKWSAKSIDRLDRERLGRDVVIRPHETLIDG